jgi:hypothetical protein
VQTVTDSGTLGHNTHIIRPLRIEPETFQNKVRLVATIPYYPKHLVLYIPKVPSSNLDTEVSFIASFYLLNFGAEVRAQWFCGRRFIMPALVDYWNDY